jgi:hypothetical protein
MFWGDLANSNRSRSESAQSRCSCRIDSQMVVFPYKLPACVISILHILPEGQKSKEGITEP